MNKLQKIAYANCSSMIAFNKEVTGAEPMPRSTNIAKVGWMNSGEDRTHGLFVEFFGYKDKPNVGYIYETTDYNLFAELVSGQFFPGDDRRSTGKVFYEKVKAAKIPFDKIF